MASQQPLQIEVGNDLPNDPGHVLQRGNDLFSFYDLRISEDYANSELHVLVALRDRHGKQWVAILEKGVTSSHFQPALREALRKAATKRFVDFFLFRFREGVREQATSSRNEEAVFVPVVQCMQIPESPTLPSHIWFGTIDCFNCLWPSTLYFSNLSGFVFLGGLKDWIIGEFDAGQSADINEMSCEVIQRTPKILDCVSDEGSPLRGDGLHKVDVICALSRLRVVLMREGIWAGFVESDDCFVEIEDVFVGPFNFTFRCSNTSSCLRIRSAYQLLVMRGYLPPQAAVHPLPISGGYSSCRSLPVKRTS